jgi:cobalamin biosynthesis protein CobT
VKEDTLDSFKRALSSTVKAIAEDKELEVVFGSNSSSTEDKIVLPEINNVFDLDNISSIRGIAIHIVNSYLIKKRIEKFMNL